MYVHTVCHAYVFQYVCINVDLEQHRGGGTGREGGVKLVMRSLENRLHNGVMEGR